MICGIIAQRVVPGSGITSDDTISVNEGVPLAHTLTANDTVEWSIVGVANGGAADAARFSISGSTLRWLGNGVQDYEDPIDANADNVYEVTVRAINLGGGIDTQNISVTVLDTGIGTAPLDGLSEEPTSAFSLSRNLIGAYDGGDFYAASSGLITQLDDQTGAGRHLTALTTTRPAVSSAGAMGRACADFNGTANVMAGSSYADLFEPTVAYVVISGIVTSIGTNDSVVGQNDALWTDDGLSFGVALKSGTPSIHAFQTNAGPYNSTTHTLTLGVPFVFELKRSGTVLKSRLNGGSWTTAGMSQAEAIGTSNVISIGANAVPEQFSDCSIFEFVTYDAALADAEEDALAADMLEYVAGVEGEAAGVASGVGASVFFGEMLTTELWTPSTDDLEAAVALWFDASDGTTITESGGAVSQWDDNAQGLHVTQASAGSKPTYVEGSTDELNGLGYVEFDGGDYLNKTSALGDHVPFVQTTFMVALPTGEGTSVYWTTNGSAIRGNIELSLSNLRYQGSSANHTNVNPSDLWHVFSGHIGGGGTRELYVDGLLRDSNSTGTDTGTPLPTQIWLGSAGGDSYFIGRLGEFLQYEGLLGTADRRKVEGYLAHKWGMQDSLPIDHPYRSEPPYTAGLFTEMEGVAEGDGTATGVGVALSANSATASAAGTGASSVVGQEVTSGPHRYWRIYATTNNGDPSYIGASQIEMYESVYDGPNVLTGGTASASSEFSGTFPASKCVNDVYHAVGNNRWASTSTGGTNEWWKYDFGASNDKEIVSIGVFACTDGEYDMTMKDILVEHSDDNSSWTTAWTGTLTYYASDTFRRASDIGAVPGYSNSPYGTHTYWRTLIQASVGTAVSCAELEMRATIGGGDQCSGGTASVSASTLGSAASIFDDNNSTHWALNGGAGAWIKYQFTSPVTVGEVAWRIRGDSNPTHAPNDFLVQFSDDNTKWTTAWQVLNETSWGNGEQRVFISSDYVTTEVSVLDGLGATSAFSASRDLITLSIGLPRYTTVSSAVDWWRDQTGGGRGLINTSATNRPIIETAGSNSRSSVSFDGSNDWLQMIGIPLSALISASTGYMIVSCVLDTVSTNSGTLIDNDAILSDSGGFVGLYLKNNAGAHTVHGYNWDGSTDSPTGHSVSTGSVVVVEWKHTGGNISTRVDGGSWNSTASGNTSTLTGTLAIGADIVGTPNYTDIRIIELATFDTTLTTEQEDDLVAAFQAWAGT